jgi:pyruvate dehydrogenase E1 component alpha subunit
VNFAAQRELPILFVCENNRYAICADVMARMRGSGPAGRAEALGVPARSVREQDVLAIRGAAGEAVAELREGRGPRFLECATWRWREHVGPGDDTHLGYRSAEDDKAWREDDALARLADTLAPDARAQVEREVAREIHDARAFAEASPFPGAEELWTHVVSD